ncbi:Putative serine/threonine-protein kinase pknL [Minicystis rosea]|nr:Putative serine/threonine-protein kinase pknL [Minicystis rosea]
MADPAPVSHLDETLIAPATEGPPHPERTGVGAVSSAAFVPSSGERQVLAHRYEILSLIGAGGMGTVYRARDLELEEMVALKVLRRELVDAPGILERFRREVKLARRVTHHNVARVFDIGEHEGEKFLTMELVDGEPLSAVIARVGAMSAARAAEIARAIAEGLMSAHAAGVVHRDLKPDNVLIGKDGRVVISDFGIARGLLDLAGASSTMGMLLGTPAYMAPEQVEGRADIDARADIYAFGALLFELFTGARVWPGDSPIVVASARLHGPPPDPRTKKPSLPAACAELTLRCLARERHDRPASMAQIVSDLTTIAATVTEVTLTTPRTPAMLAVTPTPAPSGEKTVAVLPFRNGGAHEDDYLAEELTDDLIDALSMTRGLKVRSRGTVARFRGTDLDPREIGRELGVQVVVDGSVRRARGHVRISARLVSVSDGFQLWAKRFDRPEQEVLSINDEVARAISAALTVDASAAAQRVAPSDPVAIDLYLRARHEYRKFWPEHVERSVGLFEQALALAPDDPLILSGLAVALTRRAFFAGGDGFDVAHRIADRAVQAAPEMGEAQLALGTVLFHSGAPAEAVRALKKAVARSPGLADAHAALGRLLVEAGAPEDGLRRLEAAIRLDPDAPNVGAEIGRLHALFGRWDESEAEMMKLMARDDKFAFWTLRARMALWRRQHELAEAYLLELGDSEKSLLIPQMILELARARKLPGGMMPDIEIFTALKSGGLRRRALSYQLRAEIFGFLNDGDRAIEAIAGALENGLIDREWLERCPILDVARAHPGYAPLHAALVRRTDEILAAYRAP